jgi:hypothetical protein
MLTIEQASIECANIYLQGYRDSCTVDENDFIDVFEAGVEFATKWINVDYELPQIGEKVITKMNKDKRTSYGIATRIREEWEIDAHWIDHTFSNMNITHWRPIELK